VIESRTTRGEGNEIGGPDRTPDGLDFEKVGQKVAGLTKSKRGVRKKSGLNPFNVAQKVGNGVRKKIGLNPFKNRIARI
jgi:hypothetical protein